MTTGHPEPLLTFVGTATLDALALVERYPGADERVVATHLAYAGGGPAATAAVVAARLGHRTAFVGAVGDDDEGQRIVAGLELEGVDTTGVLIVPGVPSGASVVVVASATSTRAISNRPLPLIDLTEQVRARELFAASAWVHVDHIGWRPTMTALSAASRQPLLSFDGGHQVVDFTCAGLDLYVPTVEALIIRYGDRPIHELLATAQAEGAGTVVATHGSHGAFALGPGGRVEHVESFSVEVVSTLGAGDVFHGALLAELAHGYRLTEAVQRANAVAALSCRALDGRSAIPTAAELDRYLTSQTSHRSAIATTN
jgi:sulfofructose kinase